MGSGIVRTVTRTTNRARVKQSVTQAETIVNQEIKELQATIHQTCHEYQQSANDENSAPAKPKASSPLGSKCGIAEVN
jgi:hypothetical protein